MKIIKRHKQINTESIKPQDNCIYMLKHKIDVSKTNIISISPTETFFLKEKIERCLSINEKKMLLHSFHDGRQRIDDYCFERESQKIDDMLPNKLYLRHHKTGESFKFNYRDRESNRIEITIKPREIKIITLGDLNKSRISHINRLLKTFFISDR